MRSLRSAYGDAVSRLYGNVPLATSRESVSRKRYGFSQLLNVSMKLGADQLEYSAAF
jgi:hypothetical protein